MAAIANNQQNTIIHVQHSNPSFAGSAQEIIKTTTMNFEVFTTKPNGPLTYVNVGKATISSETGEHPEIKPIL